IRMAASRPDMRSQVFPRRSRRQSPQELLRWSPRIRPTAGAQHSCNSLAATLRRSTRRRNRPQADVDRMQARSVLPIILLLHLPPLHGQARQGAGANAPDRNYKLLREDEDWSFLRDPALRQDFWDPIKYIPLPSVCRECYLTLGGELRQVWERVGNDNWG